MLWLHSLAGNLTLYVLGMTGMHMASVINNTWYGFQHVIMSCIVQATPIPPQHYRTVVKCMCVCVCVCVFISTPHPGK